MKKKYHYFYKITNLINNHFYYGVHNTNNLNDNYMGSGIRLRYAYKKYGVENFKKEILKFFDTDDAAFEYESEVVTEQLINDINCYNIQVGGKGLNTIGLVTVKDKDGNIFDISKNDQRYINKEVLPIHKNEIQVIDKNGKRIFVSIDDPRYISGELKMWSEGLVTVKDKNNNYYHVSVNDPRYISGELTFLWTNKKRKQESIEKTKNTFKKIHHQQGEKNSQYGTVWVSNDKLLLSKKIKKDELKIYEESDWYKGRKYLKK